MRLEAENTPGFDDATGTEMARLGFEGDSDNEFDINQLEYTFPVSEQANLYITTDSSDLQLVANSASSFSSSGRGLFPALVDTVQSIDKTLVPQCV